MYMNYAFYRGDINAKKSDTKVHLWFTCMRKIFIFNKNSYMTSTEIFKKSNIFECQLILKEIFLPFLY